MTILITAVITFTVTAGWQILASRKIRANQLFMSQSLLQELNNMAIKLGHRDFIDYLVAEKGKEYALIASVNLKSFLDSFTARGAD